MDIGSKASYPSGNLSNFHPHAFTIDGVDCASMEGFLQSLKFDKVHMQEFICTLVGKGAKKAGSKKKWFRKQELYWKGDVYKRDSKEYQDLLDRAYDALFENESFRKTLMATNNANLTHSMGKNKISETVLTEREFCSRLMKLREKL